MENKTSTVMSINVGKLLSARNCSKKGDYLGLGLLSVSEEEKFRTDIRRMQGEYLGRPDAPQKIEDFILTQSKREWYKMDAQYDIIINEEAAYQKRLASFFVGKKTAAFNILWSVPVSLTVGNTPVSEVYGFVHAILNDESEEGGYTAVIIGEGKPSYSKYAKRKEARPEYAPEMIGAYLSLSGTFGANLKVIMVYPRRKEDTVTSEFKVDSQIVTADLSKVPVKELTKRFQDAFASNGAQPECTSCLYESLCSGMCVRKADKGSDQESQQQTKTGLKFTKSQEEVVNFTEGSCAVYAVPGAGKTTTLVHRLIKLLEAGIDPKHILFVTFTNKAAEEILSRVKGLLHTEFEEELPDIFTYNGLGWQILRDHRDITGNLKLLSSMDEKRILMECIDAFTEPLTGYSYRYVEGKYGLLPSLLNTFQRLEEDKIKEESALVQKGHSPEQISRLKKMYKDRLNEDHYIDYDQQITLAKQLLVDHPELCLEYGNRWQYIMADEYQDSSQDNVDLLYAIADAGKRNLVVVGDTDQSIYEWRNGSPKHLLEFATHYPECKQIYMNDNFRSVKQILDASNELISKNANRIDMFMVAHKDSNALPYRMKKCGYHKVTTILKMLRSKNYEYGDIGILSRTNAPLNKVKALLDQEGIDSISPSDYLTKDPFFILVKDILDMFFIGFSETDMGFYRYMMALGVELPPKKDVKETFYQNLVQYYAMVPIEAESMNTMLAYAVEEDECQKNEPLYMAFQKLYQIFSQLLASSDPAASIRIICSAFYADEDAPAVLELKRLIDQQDFSDLQTFREYLNCMQELQDERKIEHLTCPDKVNLMTAHSSKGKEFPAIIILQAEDFGTTEEERRLLYVAMTRAKKCLFVMESPMEECELLSEISNYMLTLTFS